MHQTRWITAVVLFAAGVAVVFWGKALRWLGRGVENGYIKADGYRTELADAIRKKALAPDG